MSDKTIEMRRMPQRPANGLLAWQSTIGYISTEYHTTAELLMRVLPQAEALIWQASVSWGDHTAAVDTADSLPHALRDLWPALTAVQQVFKRPEDRVRQPALYQDDQWLDADTARTLNSLIAVTQAVFHSQWALVFMYGAVEKPALRVRARLIANDATIQIGGNGPTLREACRDLYRNAAPDYFARSGRTVDQSLLS